jgi:hypothetical protein
MSYPQRPLEKLTVMITSAATNDCFCEAFQGTLLKLANSAYGAATDYVTHEEMTPVEIGFCPISVCEKSGAAAGI